MSEALDRASRLGFVSGEASQAQKLHALVEVANETRRANEERAEKIGACQGAGRRHRARRRYRFVATGDIYSVALIDLEQKAPPMKYPERLTLEESAQIATRQKRALTFS